jgi:demethylmacrocin O-methyltransferase
VSLDHHDLGALFDHHGSDKESYHHYSPVYEGLFAGKRHEVGRVLEIGVYQGGSLRAWKDYFPHAVIVGLDIDFSNMSYQVEDWTKERILLIQGDQTDPTDLDRAARFGPFDLIVDDGSHDISDQLGSLLNLWSTLAPGGWYVIEDILTTAHLYTLRHFPGARVEVLNEDTNSVLVAIQRPPTLPTL